MAPLLRSLSTASSSSGSYNGKRLRSNSAGWRKQELIGIPHRIKRSISNKSSKNEGNNSVFMPPHTVQEFDSAKRALEKLVKESNFFPLEAASDDWFGSGSGKLDDDENDSICSSCSLSLGDDSCIHEEKSPRQSSRRQVPTVHEKNVVAGSILGSGGFCEVRLAYIANEKLSKSWHQESTEEFPISEAAKSKNASMTKIDEVPEDGQGYLESHIISDNPNGLNASYAMKYLSPTKFLPKQVNDYCPPTAVNKEFERAIADLVTEARFLSMLSHPNIITLYYVSEGKLEENFNCGEKFTFYIHQYGYFLLLDKLHETLSQRINNAFIAAVLPPRSSSSSSESSSKSLWWKKALPSSKSNYHANSDGNECGHDKLSPKHHLANRLSSLKCIASALTHMHQRGIISRDVKSDNIGFHRVFQPQCSCGHRCTQVERCLCYEDIPKLFDFGLCRELKSKLRVEMNSRVDNNGDFESSSTRRARDTFKLTGLTGSRRWMAPEVACCLPYNQKADVYSFGMVLYHVASLLVPFDGFTSSQLEKEVVIGRHRPDTKLSNFSPHSFSSSKKNNHWTKKRNSNDDEISRKDKNALLAKKTMPVWPKDLKCLIEECWDHDMNFRPEMFEVENRINSCIQELNEDTFARIGSTLRRISIRRSSCDTQGARRPSLFTINKDTEDTIDYITPETCVSTSENHERVGGSMVDTMNNRRSKCDDSNHRRPSLFSLDFEDDIHHLDSNDGCATEISKSESSVVTESSRKKPHAN